MVKMGKTEMIHYMMNDDYETNLGFVLHSVRFIEVAGEKIDLDRPQLVGMPDLFGRPVVLKIMANRRMAVIARFHLMNSITVGRRNKVLAIIEFSGNSLVINNVYAIRDQTIVLKKGEKPFALRDVMHSYFFHIELNSSAGVDLSRLDISTNREPHCAAFFGVNRLLFISYDGEPTHRAMEEILCQAIMKKDRNMGTVGSQTEEEKVHVKCQTDDFWRVELEEAMEDARYRFLFLKKEVEDVDTSGTDEMDDRVENESTLVPLLSKIVLVLLLLLYATLLFSFFRTMSGDGDQVEEAGKFSYANSSLVCDAFDNFA